MAVHLTHHRGQFTGQTQRQPAATVVVERDRAAAHARRIDLRALGPLADARVVLAAADHVQVELGVRRLQTLHDLGTRRAAVPDEHGGTTAAGHRTAARQRIGQIHPLGVGMQALPGFVVGSLIRQQLFHAARFDLHLQFGIAPSLLVGAGFDAECGQRVEVG